MGFADLEISEGSSSSYYFKSTSAEIPQRIRLLSDDPVKYFAYWSTEGRCIRAKSFLTQPTDVGIDKKTGKLSEIREFHAVPIWNYGLQKVQIWEIKQTSILKQIKASVTRPKTLPVEVPWTRTDSTAFDFELIYDKSASPSQQYLMKAFPVDTPIPAEALQALQERPVDLSRLLTDGKPFGDSTDVGFAPAPSPALPYTIPPQLASLPVVTPDLPAPVAAPAPTENQQIVRRAIGLLKIPVDQVKAIATQYSLPENSALYSFDQAQILVNGLLVQSAAPTLGPKTAGVMTQFGQQFPTVDLQNLETAIATFQQLVETAKSPALVGASEAEAIPF